MASLNTRDIRSACHVIVAVLFVLLILGLFGAPAWAQEPPPPETEEIGPTSPVVLDQPPEPATQPAEETAAEDEGLAAAKEAAIASIGRNPATTQKAGPEAAVRPGMVPGRPGVNGGPLAPKTPGAINRPGVPPTPAGVAPRPSGALTPATIPGRPGVQTPARPAAGMPGAKPVTPTSPAAGSPPAGARPTVPGRPTPGATPATPPAGAAGRPGVRPGQPAAGAAKPAAPAGDAEAILPTTTGPAPISNTTTLMQFMMGPPNPEGRTYRVEYDNTPWQNVLTDVSRLTGLPWLNQPDQPLSDALSFRSPREFTYKEYLEQINELLLARPTNKYLIQRKDNYLTINRLPDLMRAIPVDRMFNSYEEFEAAKLDRFDLAMTRFKVPKGWSAFQVIERFRPEFSDTYGTEVVTDNEIELTGLVEEHHRFRDVVNKLTQEPPPPPDLRPMLTIPLKFLKAMDASNMLKQIYPPMAPVAKGPAGAGVDLAAQQAKVVTIIPDINNNKLIIRAPNDVLGEIAKTMESLDSGTQPEGQVIRTVKLEFAGAMAIQTVLKPLFAVQKASLIQRSTKEYVPPEIMAEADRDLVADPISNSIILVGSKRGVESAEGVVKQWDVADTNDVTEIIELKHADAQMVAATLSAILAPQAQKGIAPPRIAPQSNSKLLVVGNKNDIKRIHELIDKLDVTSDDESKEHFVQLKTATPSVVAQMLSQLMTGASAPRVVAPRPAAAAPGQPPQPQPMPMPMTATGTPGGAKFIPDDATDMLIVFCSDKDWERLDPLIKKLDGQAGDNEPSLKTFELKNANAADVVAMLQQLFPMPAARAPGAPPQMITADTFHNTVKVFARSDFIEKVAPFILQLDLESEWPLTVIKLEKVKAESIAPILLQSVGGASRGPSAMPVMPAAPGQPPRPMPAAGGGTSGVRILAEPITNSLLVTAPPKELAQIKDLVAKMEDAEGEKAEEQVILTPEHRSPSEIADTMMSLIGSGARSRPVGAPGAPAPAAPAGGGGFRVIVNGNRLIVSGPRLDVGKAIMLLDKIDVVDQQPETRKYVVKDAEEDAKKLQAMLGLSGGAPTAAPAAPGAPGKPGGASGPRTLTSGSVTIYPDITENVLLVRALPKDFIVIDEQLRVIMGDSEKIKGTDVEAIAGGPFNFFPYQLKHKKAWDISWTLEDLIGGGKNGIKFDTNSDDDYLLIVKNCKPSQKDEVIKTIEMFDVAEKGGPSIGGMLTVKTDNTTPERILDALQRKASSSGLKFKIIPPGETAGRVQEIDIHANEHAETPNGAAKTQGISPCVLPLSLTKALDSLACMTMDDQPVGPPAPGPASQPAAPGGHTTLRIPVRQAASSTVGSPTAENPPPTIPVPTSGTAPASTTSAPAEEQEIEAMVDPETGNVIVTGLEKDLESFKPLIEELTGSKATTTVYRVFPLKYVDVNIATQLLNNVFNQQQAAAPQRQPRQPSGGGAKGQPAAAGGKAGEGGKDARQPQQPQPEPAPVVVPGRIKVVPDSRTRRLFVTAPSSDIPLIIEVLRQIDLKMPPGEQNIKFFKLTALDATQVVQNLRDILGLGSSRGARQGMPGPQGQMTPQQMQQMQQQQAAQQQMLQMQGQEGQPVLLTGDDNIKLTAVTQINSIIAQAPPDTLNLIESLIKEMEDQPDTTKPEMRRVQLAHARATDIANIVREVVGKIVAGAAPGAPGVPAAGGSRRGGAVSVNADARTNSVILAGALADVDAAEKVVKDLDVANEGGSNIRIFPVKGDPASLATTLKTIFVTGGPQAQDIVITADTSTDTIVVKAPPQLMGEIEKQITEMDSKVAVEQQRRSIKLLVGDAESIATNLTAIFADTKSKKGNKQAITIKGVKSNNTMYVSGADDETFDQISAMAKEMDTAPRDIKVQTFPLKYASASDVEQKLTTMMAKAIQSGGLGNVKLDLVGVVSDSRTNSLIVTGGPITFALIDDVLKAVDVPPQSPLETRTYVVKPPATAADVAKNITDLFKDESLKTTGVAPPMATPNAAANLVTVTANTAQHDKIQKNIIEPLQAAMGEPPQDYQVELKNARADEIKPIIDEAMKNWAKSAGNRPQDAFSITADPNSNMLLINCTPGTKTLFDKLLAQLDKETGRGGDFIYKVKFARAVDLAKTLTDQVSKTRKAVQGKLPVSVIGDDATNTLIISGPQNEYESIMKMVAQLDVEGAADRISRAFTVKYVTPATMAQIINTQFQRPGRGPAEQVNASYEDGTRSIIVRADPKTMEEVAKFIQDTDKIGESVAKETRFMQLKVARADDMVKPLTESIQAKMIPDQRGKYPVTITSDIASNNLIVTAPVEMFPDVEKMVAELDKEGDRLRKEYVIEVTNGNPNDVATTLQSIFDAAAKVRPGQSAATVKAIPGTTKIIAFVNEQEKQQLDNLIKRIDVEGGRFVHSVAMPEMVSAKSVSESINKLFGGSTGQGGKKDGPNADFHEPTNTLLVIATDAEFEKINDQVIKTLSQQPTIGVLKIFKIQLKFAMADEVAKTLQDFFDKKAGVQRQQGARPWWAESADLNKKLENQVTIMAEPASNMLIAYCTDTTKEIIDDLLKDIDTDEPPGGKKQMEMVALKNMDAADMLPILTEYLKVSKRTQETSANDSQWGGGWFGGGGQRRAGGQEQDKAVLAGDTRLTTVESLNAIIVVGKPESVQDVLAKIKELDVEHEGNPDSPQPIKLVRASASVIADTLNRTFNDPSRKQGAKTGTIAPTIVSDETTNMLWVRAKPADFAQIKKMAELLDSEMEKMAVGVQILEVPIGRNVEELAKMVEEQINRGEDNKKALNKDYRPSKVSISADTMSNALLVAGPSAQFEEVKRIVDKLVAMGPAGGIGTRVIPLKNISPEKAKLLIEQLQQGSQGKGGGTKSSPSGKRGDADWSQNRRYQKARGESRSRVAYASTLPVFFAQVALSTAIAQTPTTQPATTQPKTFTIKQLDKKQPPAQPAPPAGAKERPKPATQPAETKGANQPKKEQPAGQPTGAREAKPKAPARGPAEQPRPTAPPAGAKPPPPGRGQPTPQPEVGRQLTLEDVMRATSQPAAAAMSREAQDALRQRLSGAPITVGEAGPDSMLVQGNEQDLAIIESIVQMLDTALPQKRIEYVRLTNARAADLAKTLQDVWQKTISRSGRQDRPEDKVDIIADPRTNGIYIAATNENMSKVMELIKDNETASKEIDKRVKNFTFQNRRVTEAGEVLKKMVKSYLDQMGLPATAITVEVDPQTNSVLVTGGESDLAFVEKIIESLDAEPPEPKEGAKAPMGQADIMVVPLRIAQADTLAKLLDDLMKKAATGDTPMKDFIRRMRLLDEKGEVIATVDLNRPIVIFGDKESNSLLIASSRENCFIMKQVAQAFDREPAKADVQYKLIQLQYADADGVAEQLTKFLKDAEELTMRASGKGEKAGVPGGEAGALVYKAVAKADPRTNQIMLVGRPDALPILEEMIKSIDVKGLDVMPFEIIKLEYASASALETALTEMMKDRADALPKGTGANADKAEKVVIKGDPRSRSLIVAAKAARMEELRKLIKELDIPATALIEDIRTITVRKSSATDLADKLKKLWEDRQKQQESGSKGLKLEIPAIVADERSNSLIVAAAKADFEAIKSLVDKIEALELNPMANIYVVRLKYNTAKQLSSALKALFDKRAEMRTVDGKSRPEDKVAIEVDEVTNALLIAASRENYDLLMQKVAELDQELGVPGVVEFFVCDNVGAPRVKDTIDELFKDGVYKPGGASDSGASKTREKVSVTVDDRSNILIVSASPENMELVREIYKRMNSVATPWDAAITKLIIIQYGDAVKIAAQVKDHFTNLDKIRQEGSSGGKSKASFGITVFADERSNRIVVGGTKDGIDSAVDMIEKLDVPSGEPGSQPVVYRLREAPASKVGEMIKNIFTERNQPRQGATGPQIPNVKVTVEANDSSNSLVINASKEDHILIADLITRLDRPSTLIDMVKVFPLEKARSDRVKEILDELYKSAGGADSKGGKTIAVVEDKRTNAVVVAAPPGELENLTSLIARLDETEVKGQAEVGVFVCENEDAKKMSEMLNEIMTGKSATGGGGSGSSGGKEEGKRDLSSMLISYAAKDPRGKEIFLQAIRENVQISYSERANSIIAVAPPASLKLIGSLVRQLDQIEKRPVLVKVFALINSDAQSITDLLDKMFANKEGSEAEKAFQKDREMRVEGGISSTGGVPTASSQGGAAAKGTFGRPKTTYVPDQRTNSVIAAGWPEDIDVIADIIDQLDSRAIQDRDNVVVALVNMKAKDVQTALDSFVKAEQARLEKLGKDISVQRRMEQEISVIAHEQSNQLIVSASPRYKPQILGIIEQLDLAPPQVMIQVMLAEVTLDDSFQMGMEFALQQLRFSETAVAGPNGILQSNHFDVVGGTDVGAAGSGLAGFAFTITGEDFNFLVRALQSDSRLEVIQRPMVMCQDNQKANITVGQQVPFIRGTQVSNAGQITSQVEYEKVGIILDVEPHINPDGFVFLKVKPEISAIASSTIDIGNGVLAPVFTTRSAETTVAVKDGETVVIGGLITTTESEGESKVPVLGDIPGLGILFRSTTRTKQRTELLVAMTPRVVRSVEDGRRISIESRDASGIITDEMKASPLFGGLRQQPEIDSEVPEIETPPVGAITPQGAPMQAAPEVEPVIPATPTTEPKPEEKYGPTAPRYGPSLPSDEDVVARRDAGK